MLKIVQAVFAAQAQTLTVKQTSTDTEFHFATPEPWTLSLVEIAFYDPETSPSRAIDHLKRGLWSVSLNEMRPFHLTLPDSVEALIWTGQEFRRAACAPTPGVTLMVSHRTLFEGQGIILLRSIEAAKSNADVLQELSQYAYVYPIPFTVDGRRLDALQACPTHGQNPSTYPIHLGFAAADIPSFSIPPATLGGYAPADPGDRRMAQVFQTSVTVPSLVSVACLVSAHVALVKEGRTEVWRRHHQDCCVYWILDGVVIHRESLDLPERPWPYPWPVMARHIWSGHRQERAISHFPANRRDGPRSESSMELSPTGEPA